MINLYDWYFEIERFFKSHDLMINSINISISSSPSIMFGRPPTPGMVTIEGNISLLGDGAWLCNKMVNGEELSIGDTDCNWILKSCSIINNDYDYTEYQFDFIQCASQWEWQEL